jgi:hypothetical protein
MSCRVFLNYISVTVWGTKKLEHSGRDWQVWDGNMGRTKLKSNQEGQVNTAVSAAPDKPMFN